MSIKDRYRKRVKLSRFRAKVYIFNAVILSICGFFSPLIVPDLIWISIFFFTISVLCLFAGIHGYNEANTIEHSLGLIED